MYPFDIFELLRYGQVDEILNILDRTVHTRRDLLGLTDRNLHKFILLAACRGSIEILRHCKIRYGVEIKIGSEYGLDAVVGAASRGHNNVIEWLLAPWVESGRLIEGRQHSNKLNLPQSWLYPSLHKAIQSQHVSTVRLLVEHAWADVNARNDNNEKPLYVAAGSVVKDNSEQVSRYEEIVDILVTNGAYVNVRNQFTQTNPLYDAARLNSRKAMKRLIDGGADICVPCTDAKDTVLHLVAEAGFHEALRILLDYGWLRRMEPCDFDVRNENGATPLHAAVYGGHLECVRILINKGLSLISTNTDGMTVMEAIFEQVPNPVTFLTEILDEQVTAIDKSRKNISINFRLLESKHRRYQEYEFPNMEVVVALINAAQNMELLPILQHPVLQTFLRLQYLTAFPYDVLLFLWHFLFACSLWWQSSRSVQLIQPRHPLLDFLFLVLGLYVGIENMLRTVILASKVKLDKLDMFLMWTSCLISLISMWYQAIVVLLWPAVSFGDKNSSVIVHSRSIMVLLSWINVMLLSVQFPLMGDYSYMFFAVLMNIGKVLFSFTCLITGFTLSFSILFSDNNQFDSLWKAFAKTLVMMTGEYEYGSLFSSTDQSNFTSNNITSTENNYRPLQALGIIVFLIFVIVSSIALMNLMVGLAVNDIQELLKEGRTRRFITQANCAVAVGCFFHCIKGIPQKLEVDLNSRSWMTRIRIPADLKKALFNLALRNYNREKGSQTESPRDNTQEILTAIQTSLASVESSQVAMQSSHAAIQLSLQRIVIEQHLQECQIKRLTQHREPKLQRRSL